MMKKVELLAPAGRMDALKSVIAAGADAVYVGGKNFSMRQHRSDFNFDRFQLKKAAQFVQSREKKLYVTVNSLLTDEELLSLEDYLDFLDSIGVHAIIIQDLGLLNMMSKSRYGFEIHGSTMINVHNIPTAQLLKSQGISRIVTSRDISLEQVMNIVRGADIECEYFIHSDMCASQSGQCYHSGILLGQSSNRGRCLKPCRWPYEFVDLTNGNSPAKKRYYLARKDMCMIHHIDDLISKGIASLKIEGRMKDAEYLTHIVSTYRESIDRYYESPYFYSSSPNHTQDIYKKRIRDLSTCFALKKAGQETTGLSGVREPKFFSCAIEEKKIKAIDMGNYEPLTLSPSECTLTVHVSTIETLKKVLNYRPSWIYLDTHLPVGYWNRCRVNAAIEYAQEQGIAIALSIPSIIDNQEIESFEHYLDDDKASKPDGFLTGNAGIVSTIKGHGYTTIFGDYFLNVINAQSISFLQKLGITRYCISPEFPESVKTDIIDSELVVHGPVVYMQFERCQIFTIKGNNSDYCLGFCRDKRYGLKNEAGEIHEIVPDSRCRNLFMSPTHLCLINSLNTFINKHIKYFRIDARLYEPEFTDYLLMTYNNALTQIKVKGYFYMAEEGLSNFLKMSPYELGAGGYHRME